MAVEEEKWCGNGVWYEQCSVFETNCIFEYKPSSHFRLDVVYKMGGVLTGHYGNSITTYFAFCHYTVTHGVYMYTSSVT